MKWERIGLRMWALMRADGTAAAFVGGQRDRSAPWRIALRSGSTMFPDEVHAAPAPGIDAAMAAAVRLVEARRVAA